MGCVSTGVRAKRGSASLGHWGISVFASARGSSSCLGGRLKSALGQWKNSLTKKSNHPVISECMTANSSPPHARIGCFPVCTIGVEAVIRLGQHESKASSGVGETNPVAHRMDLHDLLSYLSCRFPFHVPTGLRWSSRSLRGDPNRSMGAIDGFRAGRGWVSRSRGPPRWPGSLFSKTIQDQSADQPISREAGCSTAFTM